jgi:hypothetical protein
MSSALLLRKLLIFLSLCSKTVRHLADTVTQAPDTPIIKKVAIRIDCFRHACFLSNQAALAGHRSVPTQSSSALRTGGTYCGAAEVLVIARPNRQAKHGRSASELELAEMRSMIQAPFGRENAAYLAIPMMLAKISREPTDA